MNSLTLKRISYWGKFTGIVTMIAGGLSAISGFFFFIIGAIPGLLLAWFGYMLYNSSKEADAFMEDKNEVHLEELLTIYGKLLKFYGIYFIVSLALCIPMFFIAFFMGLSGTLI